MKNDFYAFVYGEGEAWKYSFVYEELKIWNMTYLWPDSVAWLHSMLSLNSPVKEMGQLDWGEFLW